MFRDVVGRDTITDMIYSRISMKKGLFYKQN
jgi:hypothetical protein